MKFGHPVKCLTSQRDHDKKYGEESPRMNREFLRHLVMAAIVFRLFDYKLGVFLLRACEEEIYRV